LYGLADNYGGLQKDDWLHLRAMPCGFNDYYLLAPTGFNQNCNRTMNATDPMPSPQSWFEAAKAKGQDVRFELIDGGGHGMMFGEFTSSANKLSSGRMFYRAHGANAATRNQLQKLVLEFLESKL
jgi:hypothetical protein